MNITGRLTRNAEVRTLSNEKQVVNFSVAVNDSYRNGLPTFEWTKKLREMSLTLDYNETSKEV